MCSQISQKFYSSNAYDVSVITFRCKLHKPSSIKWLLYRSVAKAIACSKNFFIIFFSFSIAHSRVDEQTSNLNSSDQQRFQYTSSQGKRTTPLSIIKPCVEERIQSILCIISCIGQTIRKYVSILLRRGSAFSSALLLPYSSILYDTLTHTHT